MHIHSWLDIPLHNPQVDHSTRKTHWNLPTGWGGKDPTTAAAAVLPASAWTQVHDQNSGRPYWYNQSTEESTWTDPTAVAQVSKEEGANGISCYDCRH